MAKTYKSFLVSGKVQSWGSTGKNVMLYVKSIENKEITTISLTTDTNIQTQASDYVIFAVPENEFTFSIFVLIYFSGFFREYLTPACAAK